MLRAGLVVLCIVGCCSAQCQTGDTTCSFEDGQATPEQGSAMLQKKHDVNGEKLEAAIFAANQQERRKHLTSLVGRSTRQWSEYTQKSNETAEDMVERKLVHKRVDEVEMSEDGWKQITDQCCEHTLDVFSRRIIEDMGYEICDDGCFNGFIPFYGCGLSQTMANFREHVLMNSKEECACFAPIDGCGEGGMPWQCVEANGGEYDPSFHRRRICSTTTTTPAPPAQATTTTTETTTSTKATTTTEATTTLATTTTTTEAGTTTGKPGECKLPSVKASADGKLPKSAKGYSVITQGAAVIHAHLVYTAMAIGGKLMDGTGSENAVVNGMVTYNSKGPGNWNFNGGKLQGSFPFEWSEFEWLARNLKKGQYEGGYLVKVFTKGGVYSMDNAKKDMQGEDNGKTLMVFNTAETITLTKTSSGRQFGPTVLAPFAKVKLKGAAGFIDGCVFSKTFGDWSSNSGGGGLQMHGDCYKGPLRCD